MLSVCAGIKEYLQQKNLASDEISALIEYCINSYNKDAVFLNANYLLKLNGISSVGDIALEQILVLAEEMFSYQDLKFTVWVGHVLRFLKAEYENICKYELYRKINEKYAGVMCLYGVISGLEGLIRLYEAKNIPYEYLKASLGDVAIWIKDAGRRGIIGLQNDAWIVFTMKFKIFRIGRLQFEPCVFNFSALSYQGHETLTERDMPALFVHVPEDGKLMGIEESMLKAEEFFKLYFPETTFQTFFCQSWLLDENLQKFLGEDSNIKKFKQMFNLLPGKGNSDAVNRVFGDADVDLKSFVPVTSLQKDLKKYFSDGNKVFDRFGYKLIE